MFASMDAAAGVLYIAITVARLVASYQTTEREVICKSRDAPDMLQVSRVKKWYKTKLGDRK